MVVLSLWQSHIWKDSLYIERLSKRDPIIHWHTYTVELHTLVDNKTVDHSDVVGASPVGAVPTTSSFST